MLPPTHGAEARCRQHFPGEVGGRRLATGASDANDWRRAVLQEETALSAHRQPPTRGLLDDGAVHRNSRANEKAVAVENLLGMPSQHKADSVRFQCPHRWGQRLSGLAVAHRHQRTERGQELGECHALPRQAYNRYSLAAKLVEIQPYALTSSPSSGSTTRACGYNNASAIPSIAARMPTSQNRCVTCVSDQPISSK